MGAFFIGNKPGDAKIISAISGEKVNVGSTIPGIGGSPNIIVVDINVRKEVNAQFMPTLSGRFCINYFGNKPDIIEVRGVVGLRSCGDGTISIGQAEKYYVNNRFAGTNIRFALSVGLYNKTGYLVGFSASAVNVEMGLYGFSLNMIATDTGSGFVR